MKKNKEFIRRMVWLSVGLFATVHFLKAHVGTTEHILPAVKATLEEYISKPLPLKSIIGVFMPFNTQY